MTTYKSLFQSFLKETICRYRCKNSYSQEYMAELLHITPRAYIDQEHGIYGFSALSFAFFLLAISEDEVLIFLKDFKSQIRNLEEKNEVA